MKDLPILGRSSYRPHRRRRWGRWVLLTLVAAGAGVAIWRWTAGEDEGAPPAPAPAPAIAARAATQAPPRPAPAAPPAATAADALRAQGMRYTRVEVAGPLETAFVTALGRDLGAPLTQVVTRVLVWWVSVPGDLRGKDVVEALFSERAGAEPLVHAVRFRSGKAGKTFEAYRFQAPGAPYARFYTRDGQELELRLVDAPLDDHEQVTSLIRDGRGHQGVDFRVPVGTPVKATFDAVFERRNWNFRANGNCIELRERGGARRTVFLLHLSEVSSVLEAGGRVARGQVVGKSGNTGHSFAPHLHYQLMSPSGKVLDPFAVQPTVRRALPEAHRAAFDGEAARLAALLDRAGASGGQ
jgi:murein DD-endopeptidase